MGNSRVDRDQEYMRKMWGTESLVTDYSALSENSKKRVISEVMHDTAPRHDFKKQSELHEKIRNDEDYDDWEYGTEPIYGWFSNWV